MVRKRSNTRLVKPKSPAPRAKADADAHPRRVHGFLVKFGVRPAVAIDAAIPGLRELAEILARAPPSDDATREGPANGATFH